MKLYNIYFFLNRIFIRGSAQDGGWLWTRSGPDPLSVSSTALLHLFTHFANNDQDYDDHDDQNDDNDGDDDYVDDKPFHLPPSGHFVGEDEDKGIRSTLKFKFNFLQKISIKTFMHVFFLHHFEKMSTI